MYTYPKAQYARTADDAREIPASDISLGLGTDGEGVEELAATDGGASDRSPLFGGHFHLGYGIIVVGLSSRRTVE